MFDVYLRIEKKLEDSQFADWFLDMMSVVEVIKEILLFNPMHLMRRFVVELIKTALVYATADYRLIFFTNAIQNLRLAKKKFTKNYAQFLEALKASIFSIKDLYRTCDFVSIMINYLLNRPLVLPDELPHRHSDIYLGYKKYNDEDSFRDDGFHTDFKGTSQCHTYHLVYTYKELIPEPLKQLLKTTTSLCQFITECDNKVSCTYIGRLYAYLSFNDINFTKELLYKLIDHLKSAEPNFKHRVVRILIPFLSSEDNLQQEKIALFLESFLLNFKQCKYTVDNEFYINCLYKICSKIPSVSEFLTFRSEILINIEK